jgi:hypothetical protein
VHEDDVVNVSRLNFARPTFLPGENEPVASGPPPRLDNRWHPNPCVIAAKWTDTRRKKRAEQLQKRESFLTPDDERTLFETLNSGRGNPGYNQAWTKVLNKYNPLIWSRVRYHCKSWPSLRPEEVYKYIVSKIFEHKKIDKFNPNRGKLATLLRTIIKNCFVDYIRTTAVPAGLVGADVKGEDQPLRVQSLNAVDNSGFEFGEALDGDDYGAGLFPDWVAPLIPNDLLSRREHEAFCRFFFDGISREDIAKELGVSPQRVSELRLIAEKKIANWRANSDSAKCA